MKTPSSRSTQLLCAVAQQHHLQAWPTLQQHLHVGQHAVEQLGRAEVGHSSIANGVQRFAAGVVQRQRGHEGHVPHPLDGILRGARFRAPDGPWSRLLHRNRHPVERDGHAARRPRNDVAVDERALDDVAGDRVQLGDFVPGALEAAARVRQDSEGSRSGFGFARRALLQQKGDRLCCAGQPAVERAAPKTDGVDRLRVALTAGAVEAPLQRHRPFFREVRRLVPTDSRVRFAGDEDLLGVDVESLKRPPLHHEFRLLERPIDRALERAEINRLAVFGREGLEVAHLLQHLLDRVAELRQLRRDDDGSLGHRSRLPNFPNENQPPPPRTISSTDAQDRIHTPWCLSGERVLVSLVMLPIGAESRACLGQGSRFVLDCSRGRLAASRPVT